MIMGTPTIREAQIIKRVLTEFMEASGTYINESKSQIFFFNTPLRIQSNIARNLGFQHSPLLSKYLDIPLIEISLRQTNWQDLLSSLESFFTSWNFHFLNLTTRLVLLKLVPQSIPIYLFSTLAAPNIILKTIINI